MRFGGLRAVYVLYLCLLLLIVAESMMGRQWTNEDRGFCWFDTSIDVVPSSQCFLDPWSFTHVSQGLVYWILISFLSPSSTNNNKWNRVVGMILWSTSWELFENSPFGIRRYNDPRYIGDTLVNSIMDVVVATCSCVMAYWIGDRRINVGLYLAMEAYCFLVFHMSFIGQLQILF